MLAPGAFCANMGAMIAFAELLERLVFTPSRNAKLALLRRYFATQPDPDRGVGLAAITGELSFTAAKPGLIRELAATRTDPVLFAWSYDYVGDLAETVALMWPARADQRAAAASRRGGGGTGDAHRRRRCPTSSRAGSMRSDPSVRLALLKLITGGLRVGASARLAKIALAEIGGVDRRRSGGGVARPCAALSSRCSRGWRGAARGPIRRRLRCSARRCWRIRWRWRTLPPCNRRTGAPSGNGTASACSLSRPKAGRRLYSRGAEDISGAFPEIVEAMDFHAVLDGELLVVRDGQAAPFADLQQRLNRKVVSARMMADYPVGVRLYDMLFDGCRRRAPAGI